MAATGIAAACSKLRFAGFNAMPPVSLRTTYSAKAPSATPNTSSPGANSVTSVPTASTVPAKSAPMRGDFGAFRPLAKRSR